jgi:ribonuclease P/MRP protein subunit RPP1
LSTLDIPPRVKILRRCTIIITDSSQNHRLTALQNAYDIVTVRPANQDAFNVACNSLEVDIISLDFTKRLGYHLKPKTCSTAIQRGIRFEICYGPALLQADTSARRNLISNATALIRATRGRNIILSSEAARAVAMRAPVDMINMAVVWGLTQDKGRNALEREPYIVVLNAELKRTRYKGAIEIVATGAELVSAKETTQPAKVLEKEAQAEKSKDDIVLAGSSAEGSTSFKTSVSKPVATGEAVSQSKKDRKRKQSAQTSPEQSLASKPVSERKRHKKEGVH